MTVDSRNVVSVMILVCFLLLDFTHGKRPGKRPVDRIRIGDMSGQNHTCDVQQNFDDIKDSVAAIPDILSLLTKMDQELRDIKEQLQQSQEQSGPSDDEEEMQDCSSVPESGLYAITPPATGESFPVVCDMDSSPGEGWLVFQRRSNGSLNFDRLFNDYENGFGSLEGEFWIGLKKLAILTNDTKQWQFRADLQDFNGNHGYAVYDNFKVGDGSLSYPLTIGSYVEGDAGDSIKRQDPNGIPFTTKDRDNDENKNNCGISSRSGWWHNSCTYTNVNGLYLGPDGFSPAGMYWADWKGWNMLKATELKIRPVEA